MALAVVAGMPGPLPELDVKESRMLDWKASHGTRWDEITLIGVVFVILASLLLAHSF